MRRRASSYVINGLRQSFRLPEFCETPVCLSVSSGPRRALLLGAFFSFPVYSLLASVVIGAGPRPGHGPRPRRFCIILLYDAGADLILFGVKPLLALWQRKRLYRRPSGAACGPDSRPLGLVSWYLLVGLVFLEFRRFSALIISLGGQLDDAAIRAGVLILTPAAIRLRPLFYEDESADL